MRLNVVFFFVVFLCGEIWSQAQWQEHDSLPGGGRHHSACFVIGDSVYVIGGELSNFRDAGDVWCFNIKTSKWKKMNDFPGDDRSYAAFFSIGNKGYLGLGTNFKNDFWEYDPLTDRWKPIADFPGGARYHPLFFVINDIAYVGLGQNGSGKHDDELYAYDPKVNQWTKKLPVTIPPNHHPAMFVIGNKGYLCTGHQADPNRMMNNLYEYDPENDRWKELAAIPSEGRVGAVGFSLENKGYISCGFDELKTGKYYEDVWEYNPQTNQWTALTDFPGGPTFAAITCQTKDKVFVGTGLKEQYSPQWFEFSVPTLSSTDKLKNEEDLSILAPNPVVQTLQIRRSFERFEIYNLQSQLVLSGPKSEIDVNQLPCGTYLIKLWFENKDFKVLRFVKAFN